MRWYYLFGLFLLTACEGSWSDVEQQKMLEKCTDYYMQKFSPTDGNHASKEILAKDICTCILEQQMEAYSSPAVYKYDSTEYAGWEKGCFEKVGY